MELIAQVEREEKTGQNEKKGKDVREHVLAQIWAHPNLAQTEFNKDSFFLHSIRFLLDFIFSELTKSIPKIFFRNGVFRKIFPKLI